MATETRNWAKDTDCADCGQADAAFKYLGCKVGCCENNEAICETCAPQYFEDDLERIAS